MFGYKTLVLLIASCGRASGPSWGLAHELVDDRECSLWPTNTAKKEVIFCPIYARYFPDLSASTSRSVHSIYLSNTLIDCILLEPDNYPSLTLFFENGNSLLDCFCLSSLFEMLHHRVYFNSSSCSLTTEMDSTPGIFTTTSSNTASTTTELTTKTISDDYTTVSIRSPAPPNTVSTTTELTTKTISDDYTEVSIRSPAPPTTTTIDYTTISPTLKDAGANRLITAYVTSGMLGAALLRGGAGFGVYRCLRAERVPARRPPRCPQSSPRGGRGPFMRAARRLACQGRGRVTAHAPIYNPGFSNSSVELEMDDMFEGEESECEV